MINILEALQHLKGAVSEDAYNKIIKILEDETGCGFTKDMRDWPSVEVIRCAKQYMPEGETHYFDTEFSDTELASAIDSVFLKGFSIQTFGKMDKNEKEAANWWFKKEVAYQTIKRLVGKERIPALIQDENDWMRVFNFDE